MTQLPGNGPAVTFVGKLTHMRMKYVLKDQNMLNPALAEYATQVASDRSSHKRYIRNISDERNVPPSQMMFSGRNIICVFMCTHVFHC